MEDDPVYVVFNPHSGKGRGAHLVEPLLAALRADGIRDLDYACTTRAGEEADLVHAALARGFRKIVGVGGDGTWSNVGNAILASGLPARLGLVPGGTGCDLAKSLGIPGRDLAECARIVGAGHARAIDVGRVEERHFFNVLGFGLDIAVLEDSWRVSYLSGHLLYLYCTLRQLYRFPGFGLEITPDGAAPRRNELLMLIIANARVFGGGFQIAPHADLADGRLDAVSFRNAGTLRRLAVMVQLLRGTHGGMREVTSDRAACFRLRFDRPPSYETDGEWNQARSNELMVETRPAAIQIMVPAGAQAQA